MTSVESAAFPPKRAIPNGSKWLLRMIRENTFLPVIKDLRNFKKTTPSDNEHTTRSSTFSLIGLMAYGKQGVREADNTPTPIQPRAHRSRATGRSPSVYYT